MARRPLCNLENPGNGTCIYGPVVPRRLHGRTEYLSDVSGDHVWASRFGRSAKPARSHLFPLLDLAELPVGSLLGLPSLRQCLARNPRRMPLSNAFPELQHHEPDARPSKFRFDPDPYFQPQPSCRDSRRLGPSRSETPELFRSPLMVGSLPSAQCQFSPLRIQKLAYACSGSPSGPLQVAACHIRNRSCPVTSWMRPRASIHARLR